MKVRKLLISLYAAGLLATPLAHATNGMNLEGYGPIASGMGGASMAYDNGTAAVMNNPATLVMMEEGARLDVAVGVLAPSITASAGPMATDSLATSFVMPAMGYARKSGDMAYGLAMFSQGGMGTEYGANTFMAAGSGELVRSEVGVGRVILPLSYQASDTVTLGGSLDYVWAGMDLKMALTGNQFADMAGSLGGSQAAGSASGTLVDTVGGAMMGGMLSGVNWMRADFSDNSAFTGKAKGTGFALKLGGTVKVSSALTIGAAYHSKTSLGDLTASGVSMSMNVVGPATQGAAITVPLSGSVSVHNFQWPETYGIGAAYQASDDLMLVADYKRIGWKNVMQNFSMTFVADATQADPMANAFGTGGKVVDMTLKQNWSDQDVFMLGAAYRVNPEFTVRGGINIANNPVPDMYMNPLFPAIGKNHVTIGFGTKLSKQSSFDADLALMQRASSLGGSGVKVDFGGYSMQLMYSYRF